MKCISCQADIPPAWVHAISNNICPGCGKEIMDDKTKHLIDDLKSAMEKMPNDPAGLAGWLVSNYHLTKVGSGEPTSFHRAQQKADPNNIKIKESPNLQDNKYMKNAYSGAKSTAEAAAKKLREIKSGKSPVVTAADLSQLSDESDYDPYDGFSGQDDTELALNINEMLAGSETVKENEALERISFAQKMKTRDGFESGSGGFKRSG